MIDTSTTPEDVNRQSGLRGVRIFEGQYISMKNLNYSVIASQKQETFPNETNAQLQGN